MSKKNCFIICPISLEGTTTRKRSDDLFKFIITPACEQLGYNPIRIDKEYHTDKIDNKIIEYLNNSELAIADVSEQNPNAFFELGYRIAKGKPLVQMAESGTDLPFDIASTNTIFYATNDLGKAESAKNQLLQTMTLIDEQTQKLAKVQNSVQENNAGASSELSTEILTTLFSVQNSITNIEESLKNNNSETIKSVISGMQSSQPQMSQADALQYQLISEALKNPEGMVKILEFSEKITKNQKI